ncbi:hypothetical protein [Streptomyces formicae]|uniref:Secreted protein n=1 Tax=Streptomyces formicae TaxID=1616117 RepID=A0ABY3WQ88_9ACTN|nr:hypothetical protein [Streptomyces formicae]UNM13815.1 hypothetical protein J4032_22235 [Streptomyces formicae]
MSPALQGFAWVAGIWMAIAIYTTATWNRRRPPHPTRTAADVQADVEAHRARREADAASHGPQRLAQALHDYDQVWAIWPDPPSWRVAQAQHRIDTAKQRREEGQ